VTAAVVTAERVVPEGRERAVARVLVVEDDRELAAAVAATLTDEYYDVSVAGDGEEALELARASAFDAALVDLLLPGLAGSEVCRVLREVSPHTSVLVMTALGSPDDVLRGFESGADDYLVKPFGLAELRARLHAVLRRHGPPPSAPSGVGTAVVHSFGGLHLDTESGRVWVRQAEVHLRPRERALLEVLLRSPGLVLTRRTIKAAVWGAGSGAGVADATILYHVSQLRRSLVAAGAGCVIETVYGLGWRLVACPGG
jgi:DNA-binding response OmpR family regulator